MSLISNQTVVDKATLNASGQAGAAFAVTLTPSQSGTVFLCQKLPGGTFTVNLPSPTIPGLKYTFIMDQVAVVAQIISLLSPGGNATMTGIWIGATPNVNVTANPSTVARANFTATAQWGDKWELISDGTLWKAYGITGVNAGLGFAAA